MPFPIQTRHTHIAYVVTLHVCGQSANSQDGGGGGGINEIGVVVLFNPNGTQQHKTAHLTDTGICGR